MISRFDLGGVGTYYTRPMPLDWSKRRDIDLLADGQAEFEFAIPLAELPRVSPQLARQEGRVQGHVRFSRELGWPVADVELTAEVPLTCQRCLEPMQARIDAAGKAALVADPMQADRVPAGMETVHADEGRISIRDLAEEELMLSLPLVPLHEPGECTGTASEGTATEDAPDAEIRQRPFERLGELLKRDK